MIYLCLFEDDTIDNFLPIVDTRSVYQLRLGAKTLHRRVWDKMGRPSRIFHVRPQLAELVSTQYNIPVNSIPEGASVLFVNGRLVSGSSAFYKMLMDTTRTEKESKVFLQGEDVVAAWLPQTSPDMLSQGVLTRERFGSAAEEKIGSDVILLHQLWNIMDNLHDTLLDDIQDLIQYIPSLDRSRSKIDQHATVINPADIYIDRHVQVAPGAILNASEGPIYIDAGARVMESAIVKGPVYIGPQSVVKAQTNIEQSSVGPVCKVAGEIHSAIFQSYSNKAHAGFVGNTYIGSWCNLGADSNTSNLRNDYAQVTLYNKKLGLYTQTGRQFLGLIMGDHSKCGINTMFNTGTLVGVSCNLYGGGFQPRYVPSFSWGSHEGTMEPFRIDKAIQVAERVMARRNIELTEGEKKLLQRIFKEEHEHVATS